MTTDMQSIDTIQVCVVGGEPSLVNNTFAKHLAEYGLSVGKHIDRKRVVEHVPPECKAIICIKDMSQPSARNSALAIAKARGIPFSNVQRKWSKAKPVLENNGILALGLALMESKKSSLSVQSKIDCAVEYLVEQMKKGRAPKLDEITGMLQTTFGLSVSVSYHEFSDYWSRAQAGFNPVKSPTITHETRLANQEIYSGTQTFLEENPSFMMFPKKLVETMTDIWDDEGQALPNKDSVKAVVSRARKDLRTKWFETGKRHSSGQKRSKNEKQELAEAKLRWLRQMFQKRKAKGLGVPLWKALTEECKKIFGNTINHAVFVEIRDEIFGDGQAVQAPVIKKPVSVIKKPVLQEAIVPVIPTDLDDMIKVQDAFDLYNALCKTYDVVPRTKSEKHFRNHLTGGSLQGIKEHPTRSGAPWLTHPDWVKAWFFDYHQADVKPVPEATGWTGSDLLSDDPIEVDEAPVVETAPVVIEWTKDQLRHFVQTGVMVGGSGDSLVVSKKPFADLPAAQELIEDLIDEAASLKKTASLNRNAVVEAEDSSDELLGLVEKTVEDAVQTGTSLVIDALTNHPDIGAILGRVKDLQDLIQTQADTIKAQQSAIEELQALVHSQADHYGDVGAIEDAIKGLETIGVKTTDAILEAVKEATFQPMEVRERAVSDKATTLDFFSLVKQLDEVGYKLVPKG